MQDTGKPLPSFRLKGICPHGQEQEAAQRESLVCTLLRHYSSSLH